MGVTRKDLIKKTCTVIIGDTDSYADYKCDGTDDDVQILQAVNFLQAQFGGGTIKFQSNISLSCGSPILLPTQGSTKTINIHFEADYLGKTSNEGVEIKATSVMDNLIYVKGNDTATVNDDLAKTFSMKGISINGNAKATNSVRFFNADIPKITDCRIVGGITNGILSDFSGTYTSGSAPGGLFIEKCRFANSANNMKIIQNTQIRLIFCWFSGSPSNAHLSIDSSDKIEATGLEFNPLSAVPHIKLEDTLKECRLLTFSSCIWDGTNAIVSDLRSNSNSKYVSLQGATLGASSPTLLNSSTNNIQIAGAV